MNDSSLRKSKGHPESLYQNSELQVAGLCYDFFFGSNCPGSCNQQALSSRAGDAMTAEGSELPNLLERVTKDNSAPDDATASVDYPY